MARQRFIWPDIWTDDTVGHMKPVEILFFIGCFSNADDEGRLMGTPAYLKAAIFPYQDMTTEEVAAVRDSVVKSCRNLRKYSVNRVTYLAFSEWATWQKPKYPKASRLPKPPGRKRQGSAQPRGKQPPADSRNDSGKRSGNDSGKRSGKRSPIGQDRVSTGLKDPQTSTSTRDPDAPPPVWSEGLQSLVDAEGSRNGKAAVDEKAFELDRLEALLTDRDENTRAVLERAAAGLPVGVLRELHHELEARGSEVRRPAAYAVGALQREARRRAEGAAR